MRLSFEGNRASVEEVESEDEKRDARMDDQQLPLPVIADACLTRAEGQDTVWSITHNGFLLQLKLP